MTSYCSRMVHPTCGVTRLFLIAPIYWATVGGNMAASAQSHTPVASTQPQLNISIDARRNQAYIKADDQFGSFVYTAVRNGDVITVQPASKELMAIWKGGAQLTPIQYNQGAYFEEKDQFSPAFLVADFRNDTPSPVNVTNAYLDVQESSTDNHPYLEIENQLMCADGSYNPEIKIDNSGWREVIQPKFTYTFGAKGVQSRPFVATFPTFLDELTATIEGGLKQAGANIPAIKHGKYLCASVSQVPNCFAKLKQKGIFGELQNNVYVEDKTVFSDVSGTIDYGWIDFKGASNKSTAPFKVAVPLGEFAVGEGPECGAPSPIGREEHPILFPLDRQHYRIPLNWHARMLSRQEQKFSLSLASAKASHDVFTVVLQLSDGRTITSHVIDLSYFIPRMK